MVFLKEFFEIVDFEKNQQTTKKQIILSRSRVKKNTIFNLISAHTSLRAYSKTFVKRPLSKRPKIGFQDQLSLNAGQKYCRMLQGEHSAILSTFIKLPFVFKTFVLSIFE